MKLAEMLRAAFQWKECSETVSRSLMTRLSAALERNPLELQLSQHDDEN
jgi:hypothetical protein